MTIEVRHMVIKSSVGDDHAGSSKRGDEGPPPELERLREEILAECQELMNMRLRDMTER
ncbi:MAG: hypothetical protein H7305_06315 [Gemmatimonadaceae bacterium]|nr:hypothetical protein [Gemmatimonadaceae bacterium]